LSIDFDKAYDYLRSEGLYNIFIESGNPIRFFRLIRMCLTETCSRFRVGKSFV